MGLEKRFISRRRGARVYKHISVIDLKARRSSRVPLPTPTQPLTARRTSRWRTLARASEIW
jgi:hypothetical protein